jgi:hypothetical protein
LNALQLVVFEQRLSPQFAKDAQLGPFLEVTVQRTTGTELSGSRFPLAPRPQNIENTVGNLTQGQPRLAAFGTGGVLWQQWLHPLPKFIGQTPCAPVLLL